MKYATRKKHIGSKFLVEAAPDFALNKFHGAPSPSHGEIQMAALHIFLKNKYLFLKVYRCCNANEY